jgi:hypothetical protein
MEEQNISIKKIIDELLETSLFKEISKRNGQDFVQHLALWLVRYILVITSMEESLKIGLDKILFNLHGKKYKKIVEITQKTFSEAVQEEDEHNRYIW